MQHERWNVHMQCQTQAGRHVALVAQASRWRADGSRETCGAVAVAMLDLDRGVHRSSTVLGQGALDFLATRLRSGATAMDPALMEAVREPLDRNVALRPDRVSAGTTSSEDRALHVQFDDVEIAAEATGLSRVRWNAGAAGVGCDLALEPEGSSERGHGLPNGLSWRCRVRGRLALDGADDEVMGGVAGVGIVPETHLEEHPLLQRSTRLSIYLDDGSHLGVVACQEPSGAPIAMSGAWSRPFGGGAGNPVRTAPATRLHVRRTWSSTKTFAEYGVAWALDLPQEEGRLLIEASLDEQEMVSMLHAFGSWIGHCRVAGEIGGRAVAGFAFVEQVGACPIRKRAGFISAIQKSVCASVARIVPDVWSSERLADLLLSSPARYFAGVDPARLAAALNRPIRDITDRAGRGWRSAVAVVVCDAVGGDSARLADCLGAIELLQSGALIIDDIQDSSTVRRGGPACHLVHGQPLAINAGTFCYFLFARAIQRAAVSADVRLRLHDAVCDLCTAAHVGQALDLQGLDEELLRRAVESGDAGPIEEWLLAVYRLKTAVPIAAVARMAAILGGADEPTVEAVERFFEAFGVAFQINDDVLNIRGFEDDRKAKGEDVVQGKLTYPLAMALGRLPRESRERLRSMLRDSLDRESAALVVTSLVETSGVLDACRTFADQMVDDAWGALSPRLDDSFAKAMLRAICAITVRRDG